MKKRVFLAVVGLALYARLIEPRWVVVKHHEAPLPRLSRVFHRYRIAHISDIHMGGWMNRQHLTKVVTMVNATRPDLVVITGDFVEEFSNEVAGDLTLALEKLQARDGIVAVMGNHDYRYGSNGVRRILQAAGIIELSNTVHTIRREGEALHVAGLDDQTWREDCLDAVLDALPDEGAAIMLAHEPDIADVIAATERFDLQLSGHTHGGQVCLPFIGMPVLPSRGLRYPAGRYQVGRMIQYTNRGLGMISPYIRLGACPEITLHTLLSDE